MKSNVLPGAQPRTEEEYKREADRLVHEIRAMLNQAEVSMERARRIGSENRRMLDELEQRLLCGKS